MTTQPLYSLDGGQTWHESTAPIRVIFKDSAGDEDNFSDLHMVISQEGVILDQINQNTSEYEGTASLMVEDLAGLLS